MAPGSKDGGRHVQAPFVRPRPCEPSHAPNQPAVSGTNIEKFIQNILNGAFNN